MTNDLESIKHADTIMVIGSNTTEAHPVIGSMIKERVRDGAKLIVCDPRKIELHELADVPIQQRSGSDVALINSIINVILEEHLENVEFIRERTENFEALEKIVKKYTPEYSEAITGVSPEIIRQAARIYASGPNSAIFYTMGITQHTAGTNNVKSLCNLALTCGMFGRLGTGVNPLRGQNNVQGACDMGALPETLPGYLKVGLPAAAEKVKAFWGCDIPCEGRIGLSVAQMMQAAGNKEIKALYIVGENPMVTDADTTHVSSALDKLEFLVVQDIFLTETAMKADVVFPAACWPEKDGTCTNTIRAVQRLRKAVDSPGEAREDWRIITDLAKYFGKDWGFNTACDIFKEITRFNPAYGGITYERLEKGFLQWPCPDTEHKGTPILHTVKFGRPSGMASFLPCDWEKPHEWSDLEYPFIASTGRCLYHYHSASMTKRSATGQHVKELYVEINPKDAEELSIANKDKVTVTSRRGSVTGEARITDSVPVKMVFLPFHFGEMPANLLTMSSLDPVSKTPGFKISAVKLNKLDV